MQLTTGQTGRLRSIPKLVRVNGDDNLRTLWKNMGNNHAYPFIWGSTHEIAAGANVVASGVKFHGLQLTSANMCLTVTSGTQDGHVYITKDAVDNRVVVTSSCSAAVEIDIQWILGNEDVSVTGIKCRGNDEPTMPSLP